MTHKRTNGLYGITLTNTNKYTCSNCSSTETYIKIRNKRGTPVWHIRNGNRLCEKCYNKLVHTPKYKKKIHDKNNPQRIVFCGKTYHLSFKLPRDRCEICGVTRKEMDIHRHHYFYCRIMIWCCTIPVCNSCHMKMKRKERRRDHSNTTCLICNSKTTYFNRNGNYYNWYAYKDGFICLNCYAKVRYKEKSSINDSYSTE